MTKLFIVAEDKLAALADKALKMGGLALHGEVQNLLSSLKEHVPPESPPAAPEAPQA